MTDRYLITKFTDQSSQAAFTELMRRYEGLVYCTCLRELGEPTLAEDAAQAVFLILARKASALRFGPREATLAGWLFQTAILTSRNLRRQERRRCSRELGAAGRDVTEIQYSQHEADSGWAEVEPLLNEALHALPLDQRTLILERFFQECPLAEVGARRGISEDAARMRVNRALERLRRFFAARNITLSGDALAALLPSAVRPAPARLYGPPAHAHAVTQGAIQPMNAKRLRLQLGAAALVATLSLGTAGAVRTATQAETRAAAIEKQREKNRALAVLDRMYAAYAAMDSFRCNVTSREDPLGTAQDGVYEIERPNNIRFHRVTLIGPEMSGQALAISDGNNLSVTCTENKGRPDRYAKIPLDRSVDPSLFATFGGLAAWGTEPYAGMPGVALGMKPFVGLLHNVGLSAPEYSLGQPTVLDLPGVAGPVTLDVVVARMHSLTPVGTMKDDPEIVTYYVGQRDHLLYKVTASYMVSPTEWDTRTETYNSIQVNPGLAPSDFVFTPPPGSRQVLDTSDLFPG